MIVKVRNHVQFTEHDHKYLNLITKQPYLSVTTFLGKYHEKFDSNGIALKLVTTNRKYMERFEGVRVDDAVETLKKEWKQRADIGTFVHNKLENYLKGNPVYEPDKGTRYNNRLSQLFIAWEKLQLKQTYQDWRFCCEMMLYSDRYKLAGQADLILINDALKQFVVLDYKTNRRGIEFSSYKGERKMFPPVAHLDDCNFNHYALQLNVYAQFLIDELGYQCHSMQLLWIDTNNPETIEIKPINVPSLPTETKAILLHHSQCF